MKNSMKVATLLFSLAALSRNALARGSDTCLDLGPVHFCADTQESHSATIVYHGYLTGSGPPLVSGTVNGQVLDSVPLPTSIFFNGDIPAFEISLPLSADARDVRAEIYFRDRDGRYDSQFGHNYHFGMIHTEHGMYYYQY